jgi:hypothetical protein
VAASQAAKAATLVPWVPVAMGSSCLTSGLGSTTRLKNVRRKRSMKSEPIGWGGTRISYAIDDIECIYGLLRLNKFSIWKTFSVLHNDDTGRFSLSRNSPEMVIEMIERVKDAVGKNETLSRTEVWSMITGEYV